MRELRHAVRRSGAQLTNRSPRVPLALAIALAFVPQAASSAPAASHPNTGAIHLGPHAPTTRQHTEFTVETNKRGQVTRATGVVRSDDSGFNAITYGNALQTFIRTPDGRAIPGVYRLTYDYDPRTKGVHRSVALVRMGHVNANAPGAVAVEAAKLRAERNHVQAAAAEASALPSLHQMTRHHH